MWAEVKEEGKKKNDLPENIELQGVPLYFCFIFLRYENILES